MNQVTNQYRMTELELMEQAARDQAAKEWAEAEAADTRSFFAPAAPDNNPKTVHGLRKPSFHCIPPVALIALGAVCKNGADKYGVMNWREEGVTFSVYYNAMLRHLFAILDGEWFDPESGEPHLAHVMASAAILLDAEANHKLNDDRPKIGGQAHKLVRPT